MGAVRAYPCHFSREWSPWVLLQEGAGKVLGKLEKVVEAVQATSFKDPIFKSIHSLMYSKPVKAQEVGTSKSSLSTCSERGVVFLSSL